MIYVKTKLNDEVEIKVDIYGEEFYCHCPKCGKEVLLDDDMVKAVAEDADWGGTSFYCKECTEKPNEEKSNKTKLKEKI